MSKELLQALELTRAMADALGEGNLGKVEEISVTRDQLLHSYFASAIADEDREKVKVIVQEIVELNNRMIDSANAEKEQIKDEVRKELKEGVKSAAAIREYRDNM